MESDPDQQHLSEKFKEIVKSNGILDPVSKIVFDNSGLRGENKCSATNYVTVEFQDDKRPPLNLFIKRREKGNQVVDAGFMFEKEAMFFSEYLPFAKKHCQLMGKEDDLMVIYPKCYYSDANMIVLENLVMDKGFIMLGKGDRQDFEAAKLGIINLAKHHALSHAVIKEVGGAKAFIERFHYYNIEPYEPDCVKDMMGPAMEQRLDLYIKLLQKSELKNKDDTIETLKSMRGKIYEILLDCLHTSSDFQVLIHGDYWNNNMLFKKDKETGKLLQHIAIDFQLPRHTSLGVDLGYYLFTSVKGEVRRKEIVELFKIYLDALNVTAKGLGHPIEMTLEDLKREYCKFFKFGYFIGAVFMCAAYFAVTKDVETISDMNDWHAVLDRLMNKWVADNPDKCIEMARDITEDLNEYTNLSNGVFANY